MMPRHQGGGDAVNTGRIWMRIEMSNEIEESDKEMILAGIIERTVIVVGTVGEAKSKRPMMTPA